MTGHLVITLRDGTQVHVSDDELGVCIDVRDMAHHAWTPLAQTGGTYEVRNT